MISWLNRYYSLGLVLALVAPLWLSAMFNSGDAAAQSIHDALIWTGVLAACWLLIAKHPHFHVRGGWRKPVAKERRLYVRLLLAVLLVDFGSKALFFRSNRPQQIELFKNFGLHSVFHPTAFEPFHFVLLLYFAYLFLLGAMFFRFHDRRLDRAWLISSTFALGGAIALFGERFMFGGVHNSFYLAGPLMWLCPPCASPYFASYAWTPADFFVHAAFAPLFVFIASYFMSSVPAAANVSESPAAAK
jgi:lipoprotein signal peptidase